MTFSLIQKYVDDIITVNDEEIAHAILTLLERSKIVVEGAGAVGAAALIHNKLDIRDRNAVVVISGGNIDANIVSRIIEKGLMKSGRYIRIATVIEDRPGTLYTLLKTVASMRANVVSIFHDRLKQSVPLGQSEVELELETRDPEHVAELLQALEEKGYKIEVVDI